MNKNTLDNAKIHLSKLGFNIVANLEYIKEGRNSNVFKFRSRKRNLILKIYKHERNLRIKRESLFYKFLNKNNNKQVITPINFSIKNNIAVFPYIDGVKIKKITNNQVKEASKFLSQINHQKIIKKLPLAIDGIKNRKDHLKLCENKINQLKKIKIDSLVKKDFSSFLYKNIIPKFQELKKNFDLNKKIILPKKKLIKEEMIASPSDFGFHNVINKKNKLFFIDFEYAGLDDPIKLICDFYCQPDQIISIKQKKIFIENLSFKNYNTDKLNLFTNLFLPFHRLKWCCIILNIFKENMPLKNKSAYTLKEKIMKTQLIKSKIYFKKNLGVY